MLCEEDQALGVLEIEGTRGKYTAEKIGRFFGAEPEYYNRGLSFGILALYVCSPTGKGRGRVYRPARDEETIQAIMRVSGSHSGEEIAVIAIDKSFSRQKIGVRARSEYYAGELSKVTGFLYREGHEVESLILYEPNNAG